MAIDYASVDQKQLEIDISNIKKNIGKPTYEDYKHMRKLETWARLFTVAGYSMAWIFPLNILGAMFIAIGSVGRWTCVTHPVMHGAYDKVKGAPRNYTRKGFARGYRRILDWNDWISPEAWEYEHNIMHHYSLGEKDDPDNVELNLEQIRHYKVPMFVKYLVAFITSLTWKFTMYSPSCQNALNNLQLRKAGKEENFSCYRKDVFNPFKEEGFHFWFKLYLPYAGVKFMLIPALFLPFGTDVALTVLGTSVLAELFINLYSFVLILPNHSAEDIYRFEEPAHGKGEFYLRQILGSVNYKTGGDLNDFAHGWLNYQVEHHLFPNLPLSQYQKMQPVVKEICAKHGLPYRQESVFKRVKMTMDLIVGKTKLLVIKRAEEMPKAA